MACSLLADESGDYKFVIKTPNGCALVNDEDKPLIDPAWRHSSD